MSSQYKDATIEEINAVMTEAWSAYHVYRKLSIAERALFMRSIAEELQAIADELVLTAGQETNLPEARLRNELGRAMFQFNSYANATEEASWLDARIDTADATRVPPKPDVRKMMVAIGPVVIFGASNFPFAFSTAGGDTASAFAAGCPVVVKAHPAHPATSRLQAEAISRAVAKSNLPAGTFAHIFGGGYDTGKALVQHRYTSAVGFTGSYQGGKALFDWANQRAHPIPVFAEMGSINPVFILPEKLKKSTEEMSVLYAASITQGVGQFCTNPGLLIAIDGAPLQDFIERLRTKLKTVPAGKMLHPGIAKSYLEKRSEALSQEGVTAETAVEEEEGSPALASATGQAFLNNPVLHHEVFGPFSLIIRCKDEKEMLAVAKHAEGQLTCTIMAEEQELEANSELIEAIKNICGRLNFNSVPTGVEVCLGMHHGGPFPATTDSRFTSVGPDAIKRFVRPLSFQNWPETMLPLELQSANPLNIWRTVNNNVTKDKI